MQVGFINSISNIFKESLANNIIHTRFMLSSVDFFNRYLCASHETFSKIYYLYSDAKLYQRGCDDAR